MVDRLSLLEQLTHKRQDETVGCAFDSPTTLWERTRELVKSCQTYGVIRDCQRRERRAVLALCSYGVTVWVGIETNGNHAALHLL